MALEQKTLSDDISARVTGSNHRISNVGGITMITSAAIFDLLQLIFLFMIIGLFINRILGFIFTAGLALYLMQQKAIRKNPMTWLGLIFATADSVIPGAGGIMPGLTLGALLTFSVSRADEKFTKLFGKIKGTRGPDPKKRKKSFISA